jgi:hypothetical protein
MPELVAAQLKGLPHPVSLCDSAGKTLGCFVPAVESSQYEIFGSEPSDEELTRIEKSADWFSTEEVLRRLETLR